MTDSVDLERLRDHCVKLLAANQRAYVDPDALWVARDVIELINTLTSRPPTTSQGAIAEILKTLAALPDEEARKAVLAALLTDRCRKCASTTTRAARTGAVTTA